MDRIYYFRLVREDCGDKKKIRTHSGFWPIFRKEVGDYEIYYLQMPASTQKEELDAVQSHMKKGIGRLEIWYQEEEDRNATYLVYEASFAEWLKNCRQEIYWQQLWNLPLYQEYCEPHNLQLLLRQISKSSRPGQLVILGEAPGMQEWIGALAKYMKGITIFSPAMPRGFEVIRERLLEEYGLMCRWEKSLQPKVSEPAIVLDYCGQEKVFIWGIPRGSIWIDMTSLEARRHALEDRETGIDYLSLKCFWKEEMIQTLDTANKIQYNTGVN